jgi:hypothetical protein
LWVSLPYIGGEMFMTRFSSILLALVLSSQPGLNAQAPSPGLQIAIIDGQNALNNIKQQTAREPIVQVTDENHKPVAGALVIFTLPSSGPSGTFADGTTLFQATTDSSGEATASGLTPNKVAGKFQIKVEARYHDQSAQTTIAQANFVGAALAVARPQARPIPLKAVLIAGAVAGAAVVAVVATQSGGGPSATTITPGATSIGQPALRRR